ncbi:hypothetical protein PV08_11095 [Exophiala spinifera]|uniref:Uncharacterized protein n=1 Tax=Exophiala spinifera TaxID=91928 RepID=A0A0D2AUG8_9EURO|nr:uncharacterized protein PV08_11095 [Exophiala spinifera]KIW10135.1 hypothetical protein PV08_11095 [Exophiala spinifera]
MSARSYERADSDQTAEFTTNLGSVHNATPSPSTRIDASQLMTGSNTLYAIPFKETVIDISEKVVGALQKLCKPTSLRKVSCELKLVPNIKPEIVESFTSKVEKYSYTLDESPWCAITEGLNFQAFQALVVTGISRLSPEAPKRAVPNRPERPRWVFHDGCQQNISGQCKPDPPASENGRVVHVEVSPQVDIVATFSAAIPMTRSFLNHKLRGIKIWDADLDVVLELEPWGAEQQKLDFPNSPSSMSLRRPRQRIV